MGPAHEIPSLLAANRELGIETDSFPREDREVRDRRV